MKRCIESERVLRTGASVPVELGRVGSHSWYLAVLPHLETSEPRTVGVFMKPSSQAWWSINSIFSFSSFSRKWGGAGRDKSSKLLIMPESFWWPTLIQEPTLSCLIRTKDTSVIQEIVRVLGALSQKWGTKNKIYFLARNGYVGINVHFSKLSRSVLLIDSNQLYKLEVHSAPRSRLLNS